MVELRSKTEDNLCFLFLFLTQWTVMDSQRTRIPSGTNTLHTGRNHRVKLRSFAEIRMPCCLLAFQAMLVEEA
jgi:hypothetical protein